MTISEVREKVERALLERAEAGRHLTYGTYGLFKAENGTWSARAACCPIGACVAGSPVHDDDVPGLAARLLGVGLVDVDGFVRGFDRSFARSTNGGIDDPFYQLGLEFRARWEAGEFRPAAP